MNSLTLTYLGRDGWDRPVYRCDRQLYVDTDPRENRLPCIYTKNDFDGEPNIPVSDGTEYVFVPYRDTWQ